MIVMINQRPRFIFIRHAESEKNLRDITGGKGERLTDKGQQDAIKFSQHLQTLLRNPQECNIISSSALQAIETADWIAKQLGKTLIIADELEPAGLGIASGLSGSQIAKQCPDIFDKLKAWRNCEIEACDLSIPGMESPVEFWHRIIYYLLEFDKGTVNVIICTRSIMVLIANLIAGKYPYRGGDYKHVSINHCEIIAFDLYSDKKTFSETGKIDVKVIDSLTTWHAKEADDE